MSDEDVDGYRPGLGRVLKQHLVQYTSSGGREGHIIETRAFGNPRITATLLLRTRGRRTGKPYLAPLGYGLFGREWVVIASLGGAPEHPQWYHNLRASEECEMQVATQFFRCSWREAEGEERQRVWDYMAELHPLFRRYERTVTNRVIPVIMLLPLEELPAFTG
jgi:deazaflavin-dependent oxidoreductase (nitroreductase family)